MIDVCRRGRRRGRRRGAVLAELAVALVLTGMAAAIGIAILVAAERRTRADGATDKSAQATRDVARLLANDIEASLPESLFVRGDTAVDAQVHVGTSVACVVASAAIVAPGATATSGAPFSFWRQLPEAGDLALVWDTTGGGTWQRATVDTVSTPVAGGGCATTSGFRSTADSVAQIGVTRVHLDRPLGAGVVPGAPVRVFRAVRWFLHRGSDRTWSLGFRRCSPGPCGTAQPVAGPLASAVDSGLTFRIASSGTIEVSVRAATAPVRSRFVIPIRGAVNGPP